jgi:type II secretory pathway pseudopilin PulG
MKIRIAKMSGTAGRPVGGFTLVETVIAVLLCSIMVGALYASFGFGFSAVRNTREDLQATQILLTRMERVRLCTWPQVTNTVYNPTTTATYLDSKNKRLPCTVTFKAAVPAFGSLPEAYRNQMLLVTVNVSWTSGNLQHQRSMQTYVSRQGMNSYVSTGG